MKINRRGVLLIEIAIEELPLLNFKKLGVFFLKNLDIEFKNYYLNFIKMKYFITLRRITLLIYDLYFFSKIKYNLLYGPEITNNIKSKYFILKVKKWCKRNRLNFNKIKYKYENNKKRYFFLKRISKNINYLVPLILKKILFKLSITNKNMRWDDNKKNFFIKPIRNILLMYNNNILDAKIFGVKTNNITFGYKYINYLPLKINTAKNYIKLLFKYRKVLISLKDRISKIKKKLKKILDYNYLIRKKKFLKYASFYFEYPTLIKLKFNKSFLFFSKDIILYVIEKKFKCFSLFNKFSCITNFYILICNKNLVNFSLLKLRYKYLINNEFIYINYLYENDRKKKLIDYLLDLKKITFYKKLSTIYDKVKRIAYLTRFIADILSIYVRINKKILFRCVLLCKCDLATNLCRKYSKLKGIIGMYYSLLDGEDKSIYNAIKEYYYPNFIGKNYKFKSFYGIILSIGDKLDDIIFLSFNNIHLIKKSNDPYGLRKLATSILEIILNNEIYINIYDLIKRSCFLYCKNKSYIEDYILNINKFIFKRSLSIFLKKNFSLKLINLFIVFNNFNFLDLYNRIYSFSFYTDCELDIFLTRIIRVKNILLKSNLNFKNFKFNKFLLMEKEELILYKKYKKLKKQFIISVKKCDYKKFSNYLFYFSKFIDVFFNNVKVNILNKKIKYNRLLFLCKLNKFIMNFISF